MRVTVVRDKPGGAEKQVLRFAQDDRFFFKIQGNYRTDGSNHYEAAFRPSQPVQREE
jgi:hypothetical protein